MSAPYQYPTDLTDEQWTFLQPYLPQPKWKSGGRGRPPCDLRPIINGILYLNKTGCQWRMIPKEFGNWSTIYRYFKRWREQNLWAHIMEQLRQTERKTEGRNPEGAALLERHKNA